MAGAFQLYSSPAVTVELERGTLPDLKEQRLALAGELPMMKISPEVGEVAALYVERLLMPNDADGDALHLALASVHRIDVLLTWNCKHLANPSKFGHIERVNREIGLPMPLITTPLNYLSEGDPDGTRSVTGNP